jgi:exopolyphosphatase/pppGpp-phosphohydrolase
MAAAAAVAAVAVAAVAVAAVAVAAAAGRTGSLVAAASSRQRVWLRTMEGKLLQVEMQQQHHQQHQHQQHQQHQQQLQTAVAAGRWLGKAQERHHLWWRHLLWGCQARLPHQQQQQQQQCWPGSRAQRPPLLGPPRKLILE